MTRLLPPPAAAHWYSAPALWNTLKKAALTAGRKSLLTALTLFYCLQDHDTPKWAKSVIAGALGYLILPADLIPDALPAIGYTDDWSVIAATLATVAAYVKPDHHSKASSQLSRLFPTDHPTPPPEIFE